MKDLKINEKFDIDKSNIDFLLSYKLKDENIKSLFNLDLFCIADNQWASFYNNKKFPGVELKEFKKEGEYSSLLNFKVNELVAKKYLVGAIIYMSEERKHDFDLVESLNLKIREQENPTSVFADFKIDLTSGNSIVFGHLYLEEKDSVKYLKIKPKGDIKNSNINDMANEFIKISRQ